MKLSAEQKAGVLIEAMPYIKKYYGKTIVIKYGGHSMIDEEAANSAIQDTVLLRCIGAKPVVVHGGGPEISKAMKEMGKEPEFISGLRVTDAETLDIIKMVMIGRISNHIVNEISSQGFRAIGLSGNYGNLIISRKQQPKKVKNKEGNEEEIDLGYVGEVEKINPEIIELVTREGYIPVISPIGIDADGNSYNVNADTIAGEIAAALKASKLIVMTDVPGIMKDQNDKKSLISSLAAPEARKLIENGTISSGMIPKVEACIDALRGSVGEAHIIDGRKNHSLLLEVFTDKGVGTMIRKSQVKP
jgi:acetylglutamate kinase